MKSIPRIIPVLLTALTLVFCGSSSRAGTLAYSEGDLLMGFSAISGTGATQDYVINLGKASTFRDATTPIVLSLGNIGADLSATFGSDWNTRSDLFWGVFGAVQDINTPINGDGDWTIYAGRPEPTIGTMASAYNRGSASSQSPPASKIVSVGTSFALNYTSTSNSAFAAIQNTADANSFASFQTASGQISFAYFNGAQGNFGSGTSGAALDLFRLPTGSNTLKGSYEGTFTINNAGQLTFNPTAVPEPATVATTLLGLGCLVLLRRIRKPSLQVS